MIRNPYVADLTTTLADRWGLPRPEWSEGIPEVTCECPPCPGRGNDGHGLTHCAECCFGSGVEADPDCPVHGDVPTPIYAAVVRSLRPRDSRGRFLKAVRS